MTTVALAVLSLAALCLTELLGVLILTAWCLRADAKAQQPRALTLPEQRRRTLQMAAHPAGGRKPDAWAAVVGNTTPVTRLGGGWQ